MARKDINQLLAEAKERVDRMSPDERNAMMNAQRESWVRGMTARCEHGVADFEQCIRCRRGYGAPRP